MWFAYVVSACLVVIEVALNKLLRNYGMFAHSTQFSFCYCALIDTIFCLCVETFSFSFVFLPFLDIPLSSISVFSFVTSCVFISRCMLGRWGKGKTIRAVIGYNYIYGARHLVGYTPLLVYLLLICFVINIRYSYGVILSVKASFLIYIYIMY